MDMHSLVNVTTQSFHTLPIVLQASLSYWRYLIGILREKLSHGTFFSVFFQSRKVDIDILTETYFSSQCSMTKKNCFIRISKKYFDSTFSNELTHYLFRDLQQFKCIVRQVLQSYNFYVGLLLWAIRLGRCDIVRYIGCLFFENDL